MKLTKEQRRKRRKKLGINRTPKPKKQHIYYTHEVTEEMMKMRTISQYINDNK